MTTIRIKRKWIEMIRSGEKKEEYRPISSAKAEAAVRRAGEEGYPFSEIVLRAEDDPLSPAIMISGKITIGSGRPEWGAVPGEEYYILHIEKVEDLITDHRSRNYDSGGKES